MDDTISRQAAKDMIKNHKSDFSTEKDYRTARACVNAVPPAKLGTNLAEVGTDCISREQAIEALDKRFDSIPMEQTSEILMLRKDLREDKRFDSIPMEQTSEILMLRKDLRELPPAQPPMPSNTSNALEALDSVNATQSNTLEASSR